LASAARMAKYRSPLTAKTDLSIICKKFLTYEIIISQAAGGRL
jgi:hypothetical protein